MNITARFLVAGFVGALSCVGAEAAFAGPVGFAAPGVETAAPLLRAHYCARPRARHAYYYGYAPARPRAWRYGYARPARYYPSRPSYSYYYYPSYYYPAESYAAPAYYGYGYSYPYYGYRYGGLGLSIGVGFGGY
jgi:hypothetical protein